MWTPQYEASSKREKIAHKKTTVGQVIAIFVRLTENLRIFEENEILNLQALLL